MTTVQFYVPMLYPSTGLNWDRNRNLLESANEPLAFVQFLKDKLDGKAVFYTSLSGRQREHFLRTDHWRYVRVSSSVTNNRQEKKERLSFAVVSVSTTND